MGKINDLKPKMYGDFLKWLDTVNLGDCFSNDVWASKIFDRIYNEYEESKKIGRHMSIMPTSQLEKFIEDKKKNESKLIQPNKKIIKS
jgi:hypothetical protein